MRAPPALAAASLILALTAALAQGQTLPPGRSSPHLGAGQALTFTIDVAAGQFVRIALEGGGALLRLTVSDAAGQALATRERRGAVRTPIVWAHLADRAAALLVTVQSLESEGPARQIALSVEGPRAAEGSDAARAAATRELAVAERLERDGAAQMASARAHYENAQAEWRLAQDVVAEASALLDVGRLFAASGETPKARDAFLRASSACQAASDRACEGAALHLLGRLEAATGQPKEGFEHLQQALAIRERLGDGAGQAETLLELGSLDGTRSENARAEEFFTRSLALARAAADRRTEGDVLNTRAVLRYSLGDLEQARSLYESALTIRTAIGDEPGQGQTTSNLGVLHRSLGDPRRAIAYYEDAIAIRRRLGATQPIANTLHNLGVAHADLGEHERALALFDEALTLWRQSKGRRGEAFTLQAMGQSYARVGQPDAALERFALCAPIWTEVGDKRGAAQTLLAAAAIHTARRQYPPALDSLAQALTLARDAGFKREVGLALVGRASVRRAQGDLQTALAEAQEAQALLGGIGERREEARAWAEIGAALVESGRAEDADAAYREALIRFEDVEDRSEQASVRVRIARERDRRGDIADARRHMLAALDLVESARASLNPDGLGLSLFASKRAVYEDALALFMRPSPARGAADEAEAFAISERMRARGLLDLLASGEWSAPAERPDSLIAERRRLQELINTKAARLTRLLATSRTGKGPPVDAARRELDDLLLRLDASRADLGRTDPTLARLAHPVPATLADVQAQLTDGRTVLIEYALGAERSHAWAITSTAVVAFDLPGRDELDRLARQAYEAVSQPRPQTDFAAPARRLSALLLAPAASALHGRPRVLIVGDGFLQSLPFSALPLPGRAGEPLGTRHEVVMLPSASVGIALAARADARTARRPSIAVFADPVFSRDDGRLAEANRAALEGDASRLPRLRFSRLEADRIAGLAPRQTRVWTDFEASRPAALAAPLKGYDIVHVAAHALIDGERPQLSGIMLSQVDRTGRPQDGLLRLHEVYNLALNARLVVLSACRTALGRDVPGEGLIGFARGFLYAGADAVIGTLWAVDDRATAELMGRFYDALLTRRLSPAAALATAQRTMQRDARWSHPQYWAAFVLVGHGH